MSRSKARAKRKKKKKRKRKRKRKKKRMKEEEQEEGKEGDRLKPTSEPDRHFYPTPRHLKRRRCAFLAGGGANTPVECSICGGVHYRCGFHL